MVFAVGIQEDGRVRYGESGRFIYFLWCLDRWDAYDSPNVTGFLFVQCSDLNPIIVMVLLFLALRIHVH